MPKINYYDGKKYVVVEVSNEVGKVYAEISQEEKREIWREKKRPLENSLNEMLELGADVSNDINIAENYIVREELEELQKAINVLSPSQKELVYKIFFKGQAIKLIAEDCGTSYQAIQNRLKKILDKLRKKF